MTTFDPDKFDEKYRHYFEALERAYSNAYEELHGDADSQILKAVDRTILAESEPMYDGEGEFRIALPDDVDTRIASIGAEASAVEAVLERLTDEIERELRRIFEFER